MVFFTCNNCGESVKKASVEKHYNTRCRFNHKNVSCMDCLKDFHGEEYTSHTKCITETEKYSGKNYVAKENKNSGEKKQEIWTDIVRSILESTEYQLSARTRNIFQLLQNHENVPRKKAKFQNFVGNCLNIKPKQAEPVWEVLEKELENMKKVKQQEMAAAKSATEDSKKPKETDNKEKNGLKRKQKDDIVDEEKVEKKKKKDKKLETADSNVEVEVIKEKDIFHAAKSATEDSKIPKETDNKEQNGLKRKQKDNIIDEEKVEKKKKKDKILETADSNVEVEVIEENDIFQWSAILEKIVTKHPGGLSVDKLKKKLLKKYKNKLNLEDLSEKQHKKFEKKFSKALKKSPAVHVDGEIAKSS